MAEVRWVGAVQVSADGTVSAFVEKSSCCQHLLRVVAYMLRFVHNTRSKTARKSGELTAAEVQNSRLCVIRIALRAAFNDEIHDLERGREIPSSSPIISLNPKLTPDKILCIGSRLEHANIAWDSKYPTILPSEARITELFVREMPLGRRRSRFAPFCSPPRAHRFLFFWFKFLQFMFVSSSPSSSCPRATTVTVVAGRPARTGCVADRGATRCAAAGFG